MSKLQKRLSKILENPENAIIVGRGFCDVEDLSTIFQSIFMISESPPEKKLKNLIYRENFDNLSQLSYITAVFFALHDIKKLDMIVPILTRWNPMVIVQGNELIGRDLSKTLYDNKYIAFSQNGSFHIWKPKK